MSRVPLATWTTTIDIVWHGTTGHPLFHILVKWTFFRSGGTTPKAFRRSRGEPHQNTSSTTKICNASMYPSTKKYEGRKITRGTLYSYGIQLGVFMILIPSWF